jgi:hypothetical protein
MTTTCQRTCCKCICIETLSLICGTRYCNAYKAHDCICKLNFGFKYVCKSSSHDCICMNDGVFTYTYNCRVEHGCFCDDLNDGNYRKCSSFQKTHTCICDKFTSSERQCKAPHECTCNIDPDTCKRHDMYNGKHQCICHSTEDITSISTSISTFVLKDTISPQNPKCRYNEHECFCDKIEYVDDGTQIVMKDDTLCNTNQVSKHKCICELVRQLHNKIYGTQLSSNYISPYCKFREHHCNCRNIGAEIKSCIMRQTKNNFHNCICHLKHTQPFKFPMKCIAFQNNHRCTCKYDMDTCLYESHTCKCNKINPESGKPTSYAYFKVSHDDTTEHTLATRTSDSMCKVTTYLGHKCTCSQFHMYSDECRAKYYEHHCICHAVQNIVRPIGVPLKPIVVCRNHKPEITYVLAVNVNQKFPEHQTYVYFGSTTSYMKTEH